MNKKNNNHNKTLSWDLKEYEKRKTSKKRNVLVMVIASIVLLHAIMTANFLFALFIVIVFIIIIMNENKDSILLEFSIKKDGVVLGDKFYEYNQFNSFSIVYRPKKNIKQLYFEFDNPFRQRLSIPLYDVNPIMVRKALKNYLEEDLDRTEPPLSEQLSKMLGF